MRVWNCSLGFFSDALCVDCMTITYVKKIKNKIKMEIKSKYNVGENVWCMLNNKPQKLMVIVIEFTTNKGIIYACGLDVIYNYFIEKDLFKTKYKLLASL